jgi:putative transposase
MDPSHLWTALRYAELNPVRAGLAAEAAAWPWSSAAAHCGAADPDACLEMSTWRQSWSAASWRKFLEEGETESEIYALRRATHAGRPLGAAEFTRALEARTQRRLTPGARGRPRKTPKEEIHPAVPLKT